MSMTINSNPRFTTHLVKSRIFTSSPLVVVDVGARSGFRDRHWFFYNDQINLIGFEPDQEECERLNIQSSKLSNRRYFPIALNQKMGKRTFYVTTYPSSSSFYSPNMKLVSRFPDIVNLTVKETIEIDTVDLDSFANGNNINYVDFIKLDVEGAELDVLKGAASFLEKSVLGLQVEVYFQPWRKGQPIFSEIDTYVRSYDLVLFDLLIRRHARKPLPEPFYGSGPGPTKMGQCIWGEALYLLDGVNEISSEDESGKWDDIKVLKLASIMELYSLNDCAIELLQVAKRKRFLSELDVDHLIDLLVPVVKGKQLSYSKYLNYIEGLDKKGPKKAGRLIKKIIKKCPRPVVQMGKRSLLRLKENLDEFLIS